MWALQHQGAELWTSQGRQTLRRTTATAPDEQQASFVTSSAKRQHVASPHLVFHLPPSASTAHERYLRGTVEGQGTAVGTHDSRGAFRLRARASALIRTSPGGHESSDLIFYFPAKVRSSVWVSDVAGQV